MRERKVFIVAITITLIIIFTFFTLYHLQINTENLINTSLFNQQKQRQVDSAKSISEHIDSNLKLTSAMIQSFAQSLSLDNLDKSQIEFSNNKIEILMNNTHAQIISLIGKNTLEDIFIIDKSGIIKLKSSDILTKDKDKIGIHI